MDAFIYKNSAHTVVPCLIMRCVSSSGQDSLWDPYVHTEHFSRILSQNRTPALTRLASRSYREASALIAVGSNLRHSIQELTDYEILVIPNITPAAYFSPHTTAQPKYTFSAGLFTPAKRFDLVIRALGQLTQPQMVNATFSCRSKRTLAQIIISFL